MQQDKDAAEMAQQTVATGQDLLQQALALFDLQHIQPVALAFPAVISDTSPLSAVQLQQDVSQLFARQELLFAAAEGTEAAAQAQPVSPAAVESAELQAIRQMYAED